MANPDLTINDILLRVETLTGLSTKAAKLTMNEVDKNFIGIFNDLLKVMTSYDSASWNIADGCGVTFGAKVLAADQIRIFVEPDTGAALNYAKIQVYDGSAWVDLFKVGATYFGGFMERSDIGVYESTGTSAIAINDSTYVPISNVTTDFWAELIPCQFLAYLNDNLTVQNLPALTQGRVRVSLDIEGDLASACTLKILTKEFALKTFDTHIHIEDVFTIANTNDLAWQIKKTSGSATINITNMQFSLEFIKLEPTP